MASIMPEVVSHFACGRQRRILLKSKAGRILANDRLQTLRADLPFPEEWGTRRHSKQAPDAILTAYAVQWKSCQWDVQGWPPGCLCLGKVTLVSQKSLRLLTKLSNSFHSPGLAR